MVRRYGSLCAVLTLVAWAAWGQDREIVQGQEVVPHEVLVKFRPAAGATSVASLEQAADIDVTEGVGGADVVRLHSRTKDVAALLSELSSNPDVAYAEPNFIVHVVAIPNDTRFGELWGLQNTGQTVGGVPGVAGADISAVPAWDLSTGSTANVVAVIDTGIDYNHPDLAANVWSAPAGFTVTLNGSVAPPITISCPAGAHGFNAITNSCDPMDDHNHGTHVAGTIGAVGNNSLGVVGVNWTASIMAAKFLDSTGRGTIANAIKAIEFAIKTKELFDAGGTANVRVLSNSWGGGGFSQALLDEINRADTFNMLFVAAAGNAATDNDIIPSYPASYNAPNVVSVAASDNRDELASFSNYGANTVHLGAPGRNVLSTIRGGTYASYSGTSMATPHVSGAAALILSRCSLNTADLKTDILSSVDFVPSMGGTTTSGGRLNVNTAMRICSGVSTFALIPSPDAVSPRDPLTIEWTAPAGRPATDSIALFRVGDPNTAPRLWSSYTDGATSGSFTLTAPDDPGQYEFRYLLNDGFTDAVRSTPVTVQ
jgi:subtilisin family serine protease